MFGIGSKESFPLLLVVPSILFLQGCMATQDWVREQLSPTESRVLKLEGQLQQMESRISTADNRLSGAESRISQVDAKTDQVNVKVDQVNVKAEKALSSVASLRLERRLLLDRKNIVFYASNATLLTDRAKKNIDGFLGDLKRDPAGKVTRFLSSGATPTARKLSATMRYLRA